MPTISDSVRRASATVGSRKTGFDAGHGGTPAGECPEEQPQPDAGGACLLGDDGVLHSVSGPAEELPDQSNRDRAAECQDEQIRGPHERQAGRADATHIDQGEQHKDGQTQRERVRQQRRNRGDDSADPGRYGHGGVQDVVDRERRRRDQARQLAEVLMGDGERAAAVRVRADGLPVRHIDDQQQPDQAQADRHNPSRACVSRHEQNGECRFRTV
jgi:hypothetical protein